MRDRALLLLDLQILLVSQLRLGRLDGKHQGDAHRLRWPITPGIGPGILADPRGDGRSPASG